MALKKKEIDIKDVTLPYLFTPRTYQRKVFEALDKGVKRLLLVWNRRAGKDKTCFNIMVREMFKRIGVYYYAFPTYGQARKALWESIDSEGFRVLHHIPGAKEFLDTGRPNQYIKNLNNQEMKIELQNGSILRLIAANEVQQSVVGSNPIGMVFSEYAICDPSGWTYIAPVLRENGGWVIFNSTPRGRNHLYHLLMKTQESDKWFTSHLSIEDLGLYSKKEIKDIYDDFLLEGLTEDEVQQEMYCSFSAGVRGSYYADLLNKAREDERIGHFEYDDMRPVDVFFDLGLDDSTAAWFTQRDGDRIKFIDYLEEEGKPLGFYAEVLHSKGYKYRYIVLPWDGGVRNRNMLDLATDGAVLQGYLSNLGCSGEVVVAPKLPVQHNIQIVRARFQRYFFNEGACEKGLNHLELYKRRWDSKRQVFMQQPCHDYTSHSADAFRLEAAFAIEYDNDNRTDKPLPRFCRSNFDPFDF